LDWSVKFRKQEMQNRMNDMKNKHDL